MRFANGWLPLYREVYNPDSIFHRDPAARDIYQLLCAWANTQDGEACLRKQGVLLKRGQLVTSEREIAAASGWSYKGARRVMAKLQKCGKIGAQKGAHGTIVTICNYDELYYFDRDEGRTEGRAMGSTQGAQKGDIFNKGNKATKNKAPAAGSASVLLKNAASTMKE